MDNTTIHPASANQVHQIDLHLWRGPPLNLDETRPIQILINQGYVVGYCPERLQPAWSAYRVAYGSKDLDFERPIHYHDDLRLAPELRIGRHTFGKLGGIKLDVGHMTPNEVVNRQFGRLAQMETFLMSNMSPQYGSLNKGVWLKLEDAIREIKDEPGKDHVWAIVGPIFGEQPSSINRGTRFVPVPDAYFCITVDPRTYPFDRPTNAQIDCFVIPQDAPSGSKPQDYPATVAEIEEKTRLKFFTEWGREVPVWRELQLTQAAGGEPSRMMRALGELSHEWNAQQEAIAPAQPRASTIEGLLEALDREVDAIQGLMRVPSEPEAARLVTLQHTISWLIAARDLAGGAKAPATTTGKVAKPPAPANLITYKIVADLGDRLKTAARTACNFWNRFVEPRYSIVIRLGTFTEASTTIAAAWRPYEQDNVRYGRVEFNTKYLIDYTPEQIAGTVIHEIGHTLGIGWEHWDSLFDRATGRFGAEAIGALTSLEQMLVERKGGPGTAFSHWDEGLFDRELMTGYKDEGEYVLPVTIELMRLLGHTIRRPLTERTELKTLIEESANVVFSRQDEVRQIDLEHFERTPLFEIIPHSPDFEPGEAA